MPCQNKESATKSRSLYFYFTHRCEQLPEIYVDLKKEFAKQWASMRSKNNEGNNCGVIQGRFGRNNLFTLDR